MGGSDAYNPSKLSYFACGGDLRFLPSAKPTKDIGVLAASTGGKDVLAFPAQRGYSLATGLGTVNITNLVCNYSGAY